MAAPIYRGLGFDPTPGDPESVSALSTRYATAADQLDAAAPEVKRAVEASREWHGATADGFRQHVQGIDLEQRPPVLRRAATSLATWAQTLATNKRTTEELDASARALLGDIERAQDELQDKQNALDLAATPTTAASASIEVTAASTRAADLQTQLDRVLQRARQLEGEHRRAADAVAEELAAVGRGETAAPARRPSPLTASLGGLLNRGSTTAAALSSAFGSRDGSALTGSAPTGAAAAFAGAVSRS